MAEQSRGSGSLREYREKRDFSQTPEPSGKRRTGRRQELRFVVQKHDASRLHYDLRLEMGGVMRSWAVPKGPSLDPADRRLAVEVEDHPIEYNDFEGTIPEGEYGGGTVMLWDRGTFVPEGRRPRESAEKATLRAYEEGDLKVTLSGERLEGSFVLVRTDEKERGPRSKWLLIKHKDEYAKRGSRITSSAARSVATDRTMREIAAGKGGSRSWHSHRDGATKGKRSRAAAAPVKLPDFRPMLASAGKPVPAGEDWAFEPKYDGMRVLALTTPTQVVLMTRNGHDKSSQFPEIADALRQLAEDVGESFVLDGEVLALENGKIARFGKLQGRMHLGNAALVARNVDEAPAALVVFDCLLRGRKTFLDSTWSARRKELEALMTDRESATIRLSEVSDDRDALRRRGEREGWEGIIAKRRGSRYRPGERTADWRKLKIENRQEFVIGGWTEPRRSRPHLGAILLGYYQGEDLVYAGHTGTGFSHEALGRLHQRLERLERKTSPFRDQPKTNETPHWTSPKVVVEVKFNEWTSDGRLRQPAFIGVRQDKDPKEVVREPALAEETEKAAGSGKRRAGSSDSVVARIREITDAGGEGMLDLGGGTRLELTNPGKIFYPKTRHTKGDLLAYYARMAEYILPWMEDRPLVLRRFPDGVAGESFYQQTAPEGVPAGVRVETIESDGDEQRRFVGGDLATLLYTVQLGAISYDPWHSRVGAMKSADYSILDLDPGPGASFRRVVEVARWVKEEMEDFGLHGAVKTSGSTGIHIYLPLAPRTPLAAATLVARIVATRVAEKHPKEATVQRMTRKRPRGTVYVDYLQNILGKTVAGAYAARARPTPLVSTPLRWDELTARLDPGRFTIDSVPDRVLEIGDVWERAMGKPNRLDRIRPEFPAREAPG